MSQILERISCPKHKDDTPSLVVYGNGFFHCYSCSYHGKHEELGRKGINHVAKQVDDYRPMVSYIRNLGKRSVRGLDMHADNDAYYILWPTFDYYKRAPFNRTPRSPKYKGPSGVSKPLYLARCEGGETLLVIEGEINALSVAAVTEGVDVVSPGGANDFYSTRSENDLLLYRRYEKLILIADADGPGTLACIELKCKLLPHTPYVYIHLMDRDANDILVLDGPEKLKEEIEKCLRGFQVAIQFT